MNTWKLLLLRHGKSSWAEPELDDYDRPLKKRGWRDARRMGQFLRQEALLPQCIYASTAKRVQQTTARLLKGMDQEVEIIWQSDLYHAPLKLIHGILAHQAPHLHCILIIGHNPGLEDYLTWLVPAVEWPRNSKLFPTAALAEFTARVPFPHWRPGEVVLQRITRPRELLLNDT